MESNMRTMATAVRGRRAKLRPHFKGHQVLALASRQVEAGAIGVTCARLDHAAALVEHGIASVLLASEVGSEAAMRRLVDLCRRADVISVVDNARCVADLAKFAGDHASRIGVLVDVNVGLNRCGVAPGEAALNLCRVVVDKGLRYRGLMGYAGTIKMPPGKLRDEAARSRLEPLLRTKAMVEAAGMPVEIVSCGGTSDYAALAAVPEVTEIQAGSYLLMDTAYASLTPEFRPALSVLTTVISVKENERIVVDAGMKAISCEKGLPSVKAITGVMVAAMHAEHAIIAIKDRSVHVSVGDSIEMTVPYVDATLQLHRCMYGIEKNEVKHRFAIEH